MTHLFAPHLDLANHHANATNDDVKKVCEAVIRYGFNAAFVNPVHVARAASLLSGKAKVGTAISFPLGQDTVETKIAALKQAIAIGADELDIVPNIGSFLSEPNGNVFFQELKSLVSASREARGDVVVKCILETGYMTAEQIKKAATLIRDSGADFVKLCSGMGPRGASLDDVKLVRESVGNTVRIKAAGGIDTYEEAKTFLDAGAARIGSSKAVEIVTEKSQSPLQSPASISE